MVRALERWQSIKNSSKSRHLKRIFENAKHRVVDGMDHERSHSDETQSSRSVGERSPLDTKRPSWDPSLMSCLDGAETPSPVPNGPPSGKHYSFSDALDSLPESNPPHPDPLVLDMYSISCYI